MLLKKRTVCVTMLCAAASLMMFAGCKDEKKSGISFKDIPQEEKQVEENTGSNELAVVVKEEIPEEPKVDPDLERAKLCYNLMSQRFKGEVHIENWEEFLAEFKKVLNEEKKYRPDDLPLYTLIDKTHEVSSKYEPKDLVHLEPNDYYSLNKDSLYLRADVERELRKMARAALDDGIKLLVSSTYRSYDYQERLFNYWVSVDGLEEAERESARPGTSQHQLGVAIDFGSIDDSFAQTKMGAWMYNHAAEYGWSLSFPKDHEDVTGYRWESWHFRFIGIPAVNLQKKYFADVQQYLLEYIDQWKLLVEEEKLALENSTATAMVSE